jgi:hypothetical protein
MLQHAGRMFAWLSDDYRPSSSRPSAEGRRAAKPARCPCRNPPTICAASTTGAATDGGRVASVAKHVAFRNAAHSVARLYDYQCAPENEELMTFEVPGTDRRVKRCWHLPKSWEELVRRREALVARSELHQGSMGRSPDHVASTLWRCSRERRCSARHATRSLRLQPDLPRGNSKQGRQHGRQRAA